MAANGCVKPTEKQGCEKSEDCGASKPEEILPVTINYIPSALIEEAKTSLNESDETKFMALVELRDMVEAEPNLVSLTDDLFLLAFLRSRKFNVKKAFQLIQNYWGFRKEYKRIYDCPDVDRVKSLILRNFIGFLEHRDKDGCLIFIIKLGLWDPEIDQFDDIFRAVTALLVYSLVHEATQIAGFRIIIDLRGVSWAQLKYMTPPNILLIVRSTQYCFPARYKGIHLLSENKSLNFFWSMIYPILTKKLKQRIYFHGEDLSPLLEFIHPSILPQEFGGKAPTFDNTVWSPIFDNHINTVLSHLNYGYKK